ncbi:MAG: hypothetical protein AAF376_17350 [Pseudomonadota bacterium]
MALNLSRRVQHLIDRLFPDAERGDAAILLSSIGFPADGDRPSDRFQIAALKLSAGSLSELRRAVDLFHTDYRDLLMGAGFGHDVEAHLTWEPPVTWEPPDI